MIELKTIRTWLEDDGYRVKDEDAPDNTLWHITARPVEGNKLTTHVFCEAPDGERLVLQHRTLVAKEHRDKLGRMEPGEYLEFRFRMIRDLLLSGTQYRFEEESEELRAVMTVSRIWESSLERGRFYEVFNLVRNGALLAIIHIRRAAGDRP